MKRQLLPIFKYSSIGALGVLLASSIMSPADAVRLQQRASHMENDTNKALTQYDLSLPNLPKGYTMKEVFDDRVLFSQDVSDRRNAAPTDPLEVPEPSSVVGLGLFASIAFRFLKTKQRKLT